MDKKKQTKTEGNALNIRGEHTIKYSWPIAIWQTDQSTTFIIDHANEFKVRLFLLYRHVHVTVNSYTKCS